MKKLSLALAALGCVFSYPVFAALPAATDPTEVSVPLLDGGFVVGLEGFYLQPTISNGLGNYASVNTNIINNSRLVNVDPGFDWGWGAMLGYVFPQMGNDVALSYEHLDTKDSSSVMGNNFLPVNFPVTFVFTTGTSNPFENTLNFTNVHATQEFDLNQVDLTAGQYINVGCRLQLHPLAGLRFADIDYDSSTHYNGNGEVDLFDVEDPTALIASAKFPLFVNTREKSDYQGVGPLVGMDGNYYLGSGFGLVGHFASSLLVGNIDSRLDANILILSAPFIDTSGAPLGFSSTGLAGQGEIKADSIARIVPNLDAKLGLDYTFLFNNQANSYLTLEAGYRVSEYFNAIDLIRSSATATITDSASHILNPAVFFSSFTQGSVAHTTADFGSHGPYVSLILHV